VAGAYAEEMPDTPLDRALRDLVDASAPGDSDDPEIPVAGTALVVRDGDAGIQVLLIQRPDRGSFASAWVFPGGKVEASDRELLPEDASEEHVARRAAIRETFEETGLVIEPAVTVSLWDPPAGAKPRIRTWFFVAPDPAGDLALAEGEVVGAEWVRPRDLLDRHAGGEATLYPPTWVTLTAIADAPDFAALLAGIRFERFTTAARRGESGPMLLWPDDGEYAGDAAASAARHRLEVGSLPWIYTRTS
jgi:8-oxo-dGTP pyrophosphatase MutT (NUDIX family)